MNHQIISMLRDAISTHLHQCESGIINGTATLLADIVAHEYGQPEKFARTALCGGLFDIAAVLGNDKWIGVAHGLNNQIVFFDKQRHAIESASVAELEAHQERSTRLVAMVNKNGQ